MCRDGPSAAEIAAEGRAEDGSRLWKALLSCHLDVLEQFLACRGGLWLEQLNTKTWTTFAASPGWGGTECCKFIYLDGKPHPLIFLSKEIDFHFDFMQLFAPCFANWTQAVMDARNVCCGDPGFKRWPRNSREFNDIFYTKGRHEAVLAGITRHGDEWVLDLNPSDFGRGDKESIRQNCDLFLRMFTDVCAATMPLHNGSLRFHPASPQQECFCQDMPSLLVRTTSEIYAGLTYQPLVLGEACGIVHVVRKGESTEGVPREAVCLCEEIPNDLPPVQALITGKLQTPLAHTALLCANRGTPNLGLPNGFEKVSQFEGQAVRVVIAADTYSIESVSELPSQPSRPKLHLPCPSEGSQRLVDLSEADDVCGAKACQYKSVPAWTEQDKKHAGFELHVGEFSSPKRMQVGYKVLTLESFIVPFAFAEEHRRQHGLSETVILAGDVDKHVVSMVREEWDRRWHGQSVIFRSSTNCEDLKGFNGAGLYVSVPVHECTDACIQEALRQVWASAWSKRAVVERSEYGFDENNVRIAVLVQPFINHARCNGVAVTNYSPHHCREVVGVYLNAFSGASKRVTDADEACEAAAEQMFVHLHSSGELHIENLGRGSAAVLNESSALGLARVMYALQQHANGTEKEKMGSGQCWDMEWMIPDDEDECVVILQARPFNMPHVRSDSCLLKVRSAAINLDLLPWLNDGKWEIPADVTHASHRMKECVQELVASPCSGEPGEIEVVEKADLVSVAARVGAIYGFNTSGQRTHASIKWLDDMSIQPGVCLSEVNFVLKSESYQTCYRFFRFLPLGLSSRGRDHLQIDSMEFRGCGNEVLFTGRITTNISQTDGKWVDGVVIDFKEAVYVDEFRLKTGGDPYFVPITWLLEGSMDKRTWFLLQDQSTPRPECVGFVPEHKRRLWTSWISLSTQNFPKEIADVVAVSNIKKQFQLLDDHCEGTISRKALALVLSELDGEKWGAKEVDALFDAMDRNNDEVIQFEEFLEWAFADAKRIERSTFFTADEVAKIGKERR